MRPLKGSDHCDVHAVSRAKQTILLTAPDLVADEKKSAPNVEKAFIDIVKDYFAFHSKTDPGHLVALHRNIGVIFSLDSEQHGFALGLALDHIFASTASGEPTPEQFDLSASSIRDYQERLRHRLEHPFRSLGRWLRTGMGLFDPIRDETRRFEHSLFDYASAAFHYRTADRLRRYDFWYALDGRGLEIEFANLLRRLGEDAVLTPTSGDGGVDIWVAKRETRVAVQCKNHRKPVGVAAVRDLYGAMTSAGAGEGMLVSLSGYTAGAVEFAKGKRIRMLQVDDVVRLASGFAEPTQRSDQNGQF